MQFEHDKLKQQNLHAYIFLCLLTFLRLIYVDIVSSQMKNKSDSVLTVLHLALPNRDYVQDYISECRYYWTAYN